MKKVNVAVLMGGPSAEREVSLRSGRAVARALTAEGATVREIDVRGPDFAVPADTDVAFVALHGTFGEDGKLQRILEERAVPYTGSDPVASELAFDKERAKQEFLRAKISTPRYEVVAGKRGNLRGLAEMTVPLVVKPARQGSSVGVTIVRDEAQLGAALAAAARYDARVVVEEFIVGRELTVGIFDGRALPVIEMKPRGEFFDYEAKYTAGQTEYLVPAPLDRVTAARAQHLALRAHAVLGCRDFSRVDLMLSRAGKLYVLEVNTIPGLTDMSLVPKAARAAGMTFEQLCARLVELALARAGRELKTTEECPVVRYLRMQRRERKAVAV
jgi:D-alanine-D-alanine ligase